MPQVETISPKKAAISARVHSTAIYRAIEDGHLRVVRSKGRVCIIRESFENWRRRLETRRKLRKQEQELMAH